MKAYEKYLKSLAEDKSEHTIRSYQNAIEPFIEYFNGNLEDVTTSDVLEYRQSLTGKVSTINARMRPIKAFYNWLVMVEGFKSNPVDGVKSLREPKKLKVILTEQECSAMIEAGFNVQEKLMVAMMITTGMRVNEIVSAKVSDIKGKHITIHGKGNKERNMVIQSWMMGMLELHLANLAKNNEQYLFPSRRGGGQVSTVAIRKRIKRIANDAGIDEERVNNITPHSFRRSFATFLLNSGVDSAVVQTAMGHADINTTMRYAQVFDSTVEKELEEKFGGFGGKEV